MKLTKKRNVIEKVYFYAKFSKVARNWAGFNFLRVSKN